MIYFHWSCRMGERVSRCEGEGTYERWQSSRFGANRHYVRLDSGGTTKKIALKKLKPEEWAVLPESVESAPLESGQSATTQQQQAELAAGPPFTLTLKDMFGKMHTVQVSAGTKVFEVKERLRAAKGESVEYVDAMALLYNQGTLEDDSTVGSNGLTESTTVTLSTSQDPERGRAMRRERGDGSAAEERGASEEGDSLKSALEAARLSQYEEALRQLGVVTAADLVDVEEQDLIEIGMMKKVEARRLVRLAA